VTIDTSASQKARPEHAADRSVALSLFVTASCFFFLCSSPHIYTPDGVIMFQRVTSANQPSLMNPRIAPITACWTLPAWDDYVVVDVSQRPSLLLTSHLGFVDGFCVGLSRLNRALGYAGSTHVIG
jgi:hypothetical protein